MWLDSLCPCFKATTVMQRSIIVLAGQQHSVNDPTDAPTAFTLSVTTYNLIFQLLFRRGIPSAGGHSHSAAGFAWKTSNYVIEPYQLETHRTIPGFVVRHCGQVARRIDVGGNVGELVCFSLSVLFFDLPLVCSTSKTPWVHSN